MTTSGDDYATVSSVAEPHYLPTGKIDVSALERLAEMALMSPDKTQRDAAAQRLRFLGLYDYWKTTQYVLLHTPNAYLCFIAAKATLFIVANELGPYERAEVALFVLAMLRDRRACGQALPRYLKTALYRVFAAATFSNWKLCVFRGGDVANVVRQTAPDTVASTMTKRSAPNGQPPPHHHDNGNNNDDDDDDDDNDDDGERHKVSYNVDDGQAYASDLSKTLSGGCEVLPLFAQYLDDAADALDCALECAVFYGQHSAALGIVSLSRDFAEQMLPRLFHYGVTALTQTPVKAAELCAAALDYAVALPESMARVTAAAALLDTNVHVHNWELWANALTLVMSYCVPHIVNSVTASSSSSSQPCAHGGNANSNNNDSDSDEQLTRVLMRLLRQCSCVVCDESAFVPSCDAYATALLDIADTLLQVCEQHNDRTDVLQLSCALVVNTLQRHESLTVQYLTRHRHVIERWAAATRFVLARFHDDDDELRRWLMQLFYLVAESMLPPPPPLSQQQQQQQQHASSTALQSVEYDASANVQACYSSHSNDNSPYGGADNNNNTMMMMGSRSGGVASALAAAAAEAGVTSMERSFYDDGTTSNNNNNSSDGGSATNNNAQAARGAAVTSASAADEEVTAVAVLRRLVTDVCMQYLYVVIAKAALREDASEVRSANGVILHNERTLMPLSLLLFSARVQLTPVLLDLLRETLTHYNACVHARARYEQEQQQQQQHGNTPAPLSEQLLALAGEQAEALQSRPRAVQLLQLTGICLSRLSVLVSICAIALVNGAAVRDDAVLELVADFAQQLLGDDDGMTEDLLQCLSFGDADDGDDDKNSNNSNNNSNDDNDKSNAYGDDGVSYDDDDDGSGARRVHVSMLRALFFFCGCVFESRAARRRDFFRITIQLLRFVYLRHSRVLVLLRDANQLLRRMVYYGASATNFLGAPSLLPLLEAVKHDTIAILHMPQQDNSNNNSDNNSHNNDSSKEMREARAEFLTCIAAFVETRYYAGYAVDGALDALLARTLCTERLFAHPLCALRDVVAIARGCQQPDTFDVIVSEVFAHEQDLVALATRTPACLPVLLSLLTLLCEVAQGALERGAFATLPWQLASLVLRQLTAYFTHVSTSPPALDLAALRELARAHEDAYTTTAPPNASASDDGVVDRNNNISSGSSLCSSSALYAAQHRLGPSRLLRQLARRQCVVPLEVWRSDVASSPSSPTLHDNDNNNNDNTDSNGGGHTLPSSSSTSTMMTYSPLPRYYSFTHDSHGYDISNNNNSSIGGDDGGDDDDGRGAVVFHACTLLTSLCSGGAWCNLGVLLHYERDVVQRAVSGTVQLLTCTSVQQLVADEARYAAVLRALLTLLCDGSGAAMRWLHELLMRQGLYQALLALMCRLMAHKYRAEVMQVVFVLVCECATWRRMWAGYGGVDAYTLGCVFHEVSVLFVISSTLQLSEMRQCLHVLEQCYADARATCTTHMSTLLQYCSAYHRVRLRMLFTKLSEGRYDLLAAYLPVFGAQSRVPVLMPW